ncbi:hypothetical protein Fmac_009325 [Flemingia macrophylla]|uniref:Uncharacterized protein n=1 Tax=Flemingia macrophylla TaxID=520843 RepID=A0ABD1MZX7_9FABA
MGSDGNGAPQCKAQTTIKELVSVTKDTKVGGPLEGAQVHIVHLSGSIAFLDLIKAYKLVWWTNSLKECDALLKLKHVVS